MEAHTFHGKIYRKFVKANNIKVYIYFLTLNDDDDDDDDDDI